MNDAGVVGTATPTADRRLGPYVVLAVGGLVAALVTGQAALAAVAAPAAVLVVVALADRRPLDVQVVAVDAPDRLLEGDDWTLRIELEWVGAATVDVIHTGLRGSETRGAGGWTVTSSGGTTLELRAVARRWGRHDLGALTIRARRPHGMLRWDTTGALAGSLRVLPTSSRLDELLVARQPSGSAGAHVAPVRGPGTDFADLRPYVPGDRLRDLSWTATARSDRPWVVVHHPERTAAVVVLLDGFVEVGLPAGSLDRAARVVWSIARHHLAAGDRVGLLADGATPVWLSPVAGRRAQWQVLDALLTVGRQLSGSRIARPGPGTARREVLVPGDAIVVGVSPMQSDAFVAAAVHHARLGRPTAVVGVETADLLEPPADDVERAARRLWAAEVEVRASRLARVGIPVVHAGDAPGPAIRLLAGRTSRRPRRVA